MARTASTTRGAPWTSRPRIAIGESSAASRGSRSKQGSTGSPTSAITSTRRSDRRPELELTPGSVWLLKRHIEGRDERELAEGGPGGAEASAALRRFGADREPRGRLGREAKPGA